MFCMGYHPRIECKEIASFQTTRSRNSELWFVNNDKLESAILGFAAKYAERYKVKLYALAIEGNHVQFPAHFPGANRAHFMRDFNSSVARAVPRFQPKYISAGGSFWARRYSAEYLPGPEDIEEQFFYTVLQPVLDGLVDDISKYLGYNCFEDAVRGRVRKYAVVNWKAYNDAIRWNEGIDIKHFIEYHELRYERLPQYSQLSWKEYEALMRTKLRERTAEALRERRVKRSAGAQVLKYTVPGSRPRKTKRSDRNSHRPRILSKDDQRRAEGKTWYFSIYFKYQECSKRYREGELTVDFPDGTYRPPAFTVAYGGTIC